MYLSTPAVDAAVEPVGGQTVLAILSQAADRADLDRLLRRSTCNLHFVGTRQEALSAMSAVLPFAVLSDIRLRDGHSWKVLLNDMQRLADSPPLIVTHRSPDVALWSEVLNLGGFDVLLKPFNTNEVLHVLGNARRQLVAQHQRHMTV